MNNELIEDINTILESKQEENLIVSSFNKTIKKISSDEQLRLHSYLSIDGLQVMYKIIDMVDIDNDAKEHLIWYYYKELVLEYNDFVNDDLLNQLLDDYQRYNYIALKSMFIDLLKGGKLNVDQVEKIEISINEEEIQKYIYSAKTKDYIDNHKLLNKEQVQKLFKAKAYDVLEYAIDKAAVETDALEEFKNPISGENSRKIKVILYNKAMRIKNLRAN